MDNHRIGHRLGCYSFSRTKSAQPRHAGRARAPSPSGRLAGWVAAPQSQSARTFKAATATPHSPLARQQIARLTGVPSLRQDARLPFFLRVADRVLFPVSESGTRGYDSNGAKSNAKGRRLVSLAVSGRTSAVEVFRIRALERVATYTRLLSPATAMEILSPSASWMTSSPVVESQTIKESPDSERMLRPSGGKYFRV